MSALLTRFHDLHGRNPIETAIRYGSADIGSSGICSKTAILRLSCVHIEAAIRNGIANPGPSGSVPRRVETRFGRVCIKRYHTYSRWPWPSRWDETRFYLRRFAAAPNFRDDERTGVCP